MIYKEERISSERIYEGKILNLRKDIVTTVSGKPASREIVEHNGAVAMVALTDSGKIIMEKQYRYAMDEVIFEVPAGKIEKDEADSLTAAKRELREETGYVASELKKLGLIFPSVAYTEEGIEVESGSSIMVTSGFRTRARAIETRCFCPLDKAAGLKFRTSIRHSFLAISITFLLIVS